MPSLWTCPCRVKNLGTAGACQSCGRPRDAEIRPPARPAAVASPPESQPANPAALRRAAGPPPSPHPPAAAPVPSTQSPPGADAGVSGHPYRAYAASGTPRRSRAGISPRIAALAVGIIVLQGAVMVALVMNYAPRQKPSPAASVQSTPTVTSVPFVGGESNFPGGIASPNAPAAQQPGAAVAPSGFDPTAAAPVPDNAPPLNQEPAATQAPSAPVSPAAEGTVDPAEPANRWNRASTADGLRSSPAGWEPPSPMPPAPVPGSPDGLPGKAETAGTYRYLGWLQSIEQERMRLEEGYRSSLASLASSGEAPELDALTRAPQQLQALCSQYSQQKNGFWRELRRNKPPVPDECRSLDNLYMQAGAHDQRAARALYRAALNLDANALRGALEQRKETQAGFASAVNLLQQFRARYP